MDLGFAYFTEGMLIAAFFFAAFSVTVFWLVHVLFVRSDNALRDPRPTVFVVVIVFWSYILLETILGYFNLKNVCESDGGLTVFERSAYSSIHIRNRPSSEELSYFGSNSVHTIEYDDIKQGYWRYTAGREGPTRVDTLVSEMSRLYTPHVMHSDGFGDTISVRGSYVRDNSSGKIMAEMKRYSLRVMWIYRTGLSGGVVSCTDLFPGDARYRPGLKSYDLGTLMSTKETSYSSKEG